MRRPPTWRSVGRAAARRPARLPGVTDQHGVADGYHDIEGFWHATTDAARDALHAAMGDPGEQPGLWFVPEGCTDGMWSPCRIVAEDGADLGVFGVLPDGLPIGYHRLEPVDGSPPSALIVHPERCPAGAAGMGCRRTGVLAVERRVVGRRRPDRRRGPRCGSGCPWRRRGAAEPLACAGSDEPAGEQPILTVEPMLVEPPAAATVNAGPAGTAAGARGDDRPRRPLGGEAGRVCGRSSASSARTHGGSGRRRPGGPSICSAPGTCSPNSSARAGASGGSRCGPRARACSPTSPPTRR